MSEVGHSGLSSLAGAIAAYIRVCLILLMVKGVNLASSYDNRHLGPPNIANLIIVLLIDSLSRTCFLITTAIDTGIYKRSSTQFLFEFLFEVSGEKSN